MTVYRSGNLYLVAKGDVGRLIPTDGRRPYPPGDVRSIVAHCNVSEPWAAVAAGDGPLPEVVADAVADAGNWGE